MLERGEDTLYIMRRLSRFAIENIGLAHPAAMPNSLAAWESYERLGSPKAELAIFHCLIYFGTAPKSNAVYQAGTSEQKWHASPAL